MILSGQQFFEFFPGVPIFHSRDLCIGQQSDIALTRKSQLNLDHARASGGIYAPTLRYHNGTFYMITTLVDTGGNFFVTATNPAGPWSNRSGWTMPGIDPSLFFDEDGTVYYDRHEGWPTVLLARRKSICKRANWMVISRKCGGAPAASGPRAAPLQNQRKYFVMIAEGGTSYDHIGDHPPAATPPWGPFIPNPRNPILTHRNRSDSSIQALGHADLVETPDGWWLVCLGIRPQGGKFHHLGAKHFWPRSPGRKMAGPWSMATARWKPT